MIPVRKLNKRMKIVSGIDHKVMNMFGSLLTLCSCGQRFFT